jgi:hypothetical protein
MTNTRVGSTPDGRFPVVDERTREQLIRQFGRMVPYYTPEWKFTPDDPDPGTALALMFIHLLEGNIRRLNQVPYKNFLAFLNEFDVDLAQARPALAHVTFSLAEGTPSPVYLDRGVQLAASVPGDPEPVLFETADPVLLTTSRLTDMFTVSPKRDRIVRLYALNEETGEGTPLAGDGRGTALFGSEGVNLQEHAMYIRHDDLFLLRHPAVVELALSNAQIAAAADESSRLLADSAKVRWEYFSGGEWRSFDRVHGLRGMVRLLKLYPHPVDPVEYGGETGYWIRCRTVALDARTEAAQLSRVQFDRMTLKSDFASPDEEEGMAPDLLFSNDAQMETGEAGLPFGMFFAPYGMFYISSRETFTKRGSRVTVRFRLGFDPNRYIPERPPEIKWKMIMRKAEMDKVDIPDPVTIPLVQWEYWNGTNWAILPVNPEARTMFAEPWEGWRDAELTFECPPDIQPAPVNGVENYWIRARIVQVKNAYSPNAIYYAPKIERMKIRYGYDAPIHAAQRLMIENHLERHDRTTEAASGVHTVRPFEMLEGASPALMFGFDTPPERGPIHLYFHLKPRAATEDDVPFIEWEYLRASGGAPVWAPLAAFDGTNGFTRSGIVRFAGPHDFAEHSFFGARRYWIRAVNRDARYDRPEEEANAPRALDVVPNTVLVVQRRTIRNESPQRYEMYDTMDDSLSAYYQLSSVPVLSEEVWVDETETMTEDELGRLKAAGVGLDVVRDAEGGILRVWVRYTEVGHLLHSGPDDRHYRIDRATGRIWFGDGVAGRKPPRDLGESIRVTYATGGGVRGNVPAGAIASLQDAIAFVDGVTNRWPAAGGCEAGTVEEAIVRGPKRFAHYNRAVTAEDFEWLAREAHPNVAKVKCLPNLNARLEPQPGAVTVVVMPRSGAGDGAHFQEMKRDIEARLLKQAAAHIAFPGNIQVIEPALLEIGIVANVWVRNLEDIVPVEKEILRKLERFLDPITGNADGRGWNIGQHVHPSMFFALLKSVGPVLHIPRLSIDVVKVEYGERTEWNPDRISELPHGIVVPGKHRLMIEAKT